MNKVRLSIILSLCLMLVAWSSEEKVQDPVAFETSDRCHACGMMITSFPGPKGQAFEGNKKQKRTFCSTMDMMVWYFQSKAQSDVFEMYVHDMSKTPWKKPEDSHLIPARDAFYVINSNMRGAMGPTLASFSSKALAEDFVKKHSGTVSNFENLSLKRIKSR